MVLDEFSEKANHIFRQSTQTNENSSQKNEFYDKA